MSELSYRINQPQVVYETFADEIVAVSFLDGSYYSIRGSGVGIWAMLSAGASIDRIVEAMQSAYPTVPAIAQIVGDFVNALLRRGLIVVATGDELSPVSVSSVEITAGSGGFVVPVLETYTDMQDLLLLDPIHEVDESGWPKRPAEEPPPTVTRP